MARGDGIVKPAIVGQPPETSGSAIWNGEMQVSMQNEVPGDVASKASKPVTAQRIGDGKR